MQYPGYNTGNITFVEGDKYPFKIHNLVKLQDGANYYVLLDVNGLKHFLPSEFYISYGFMVGDEITCTIDKINCTGRIFLEPNHPFYKEGESYEFTIENICKTGDLFTVQVKDIFENSIEVPVYGTKSDSIMDKKKVVCRVQSIKKGKIILDFYNFIS